MTWVAERPTGVKLSEMARALAFARRNGRRYADPRALRRAWLYGRFNLLPSSVDLQSGVVLDIGANVGDWSGALFQLAPRASAVLFEPAPGPLELLRSRFSDDPRVRLLPFAVSESAGAADFHVTAHGHNSSLRVPLNMNQQYGVSTGWEEVGQVVVRTVALDDLLADLGSPSLIKIDVQGAEALVLRGAERTLAQGQAVLLEVNARAHYQGDAARGELHGLMLDNGYVEVGRSDPWLDAETGEPLWADVCYLNTRRRGAS